MKCILVNTYVSFTEPFLESLPQSHVLFVIFWQSLDWGINNDGEGVVNTSDPLFYPTFFSSILSACFGISNLLKQGPCPLVPRDKFGCVFIIIFLSILGGLFAKGNVIMCVLSVKDLKDRFHCFGFLFCTCYLIPALFVST